MSANFDSGNEGFDFEKMPKDLLLRWMDNKEFLSNKDKGILFKLGCECLNDIGTLYSINKALVKIQESFTDEDKNIELKIEDDKCILVFDNEKIELEIVRLREVIIGMIDILEKILPLGTVVDLKKKYLSKHIRVNDVENIRIVITHRFLYHEDDTTYFPYAGVVYPIGMFDKMEIIHFTPALIEKIVHTGFSDIQDEAYVYMMKEELILEKGMHSYGFSTEEERDKLKNRIEQEGKKSNDKS